MIHSMTGFAARSLPLTPANLALEFRSVNQRYLEIGFRVPDELRALEPALRELIQRRITRGKVECRMSVAATTLTRSTNGLNADLLETLRHWQTQVRQAVPDAAALSVGEILRWPGMQEEANLSAPDLHGRILAEAALAVDELAASRGREGAKLADFILARLEAMEALLGELRPRLPVLLRQHEERLSAKLKEALGEDYPERLAQELALFLQKIDVEEELARLAAHLQEVRRVLGQGGAAGKRLDFLMQELHREANTLGSKSAALETTRAAMELKVLIEQMREQVQNIE